MFYHYSRKVVTKTSSIIIHNFYTDLTPYWVYYPFFQQPWISFAQFCLQIIFASSYLCKSRWYWSLRPCDIYHNCSTTKPGLEEQVHKSLHIWTKRCNQELTMTSADKKRWNIQDRRRFYTTYLLFPDHMIEIVAKTLL